MFTRPVEAALAVAFSKYPHATVPVLSQSAKQFGGDYQCNSVLALAGRMGVRPQGLAAEIAASLDLSGVASVTVSGPGFLNFAFDYAYLSECASTAAALPHAGIEPVTERGRVLVDMGGPNISKALHVGHLRSFVIGESLRRILLAVGHEVISDIHYGDWGLPIGKLMVAIAARPDGKSAFDLSAALPEWSLDDLGVLYREGNALTKADEAAMEEARRFTRELQAGDPALRRVWAYMREVSLSAIMVHIEALSAKFDTYDGESDVEPLIGPMLSALAAAGLAVESEGALVGPVREDGSLPPVLLRKRDGGSLYGTTDLATISERIARYAPTAIVYCVDGRQHVHFESVFALAKKAADAGVPGFSPLPRLVHADFGTVNDASGRPFSTREGGPALLSDLIAQAEEKAREFVSEELPEGTASKVAMAALKFADLSGDRRAGYVFDPEKIVSFTGRTGPYVQYASARIASLFRKAAEQGISAANRIEVSHPSERALALECLRLPASVHAAAASLQPKEICDRAYAVALAVAKLYSDLEILRAEHSERASRLALLAYAGRCLAFALDLLGIATPDRM